ncbi:NAD(P)-binding domain-containing protein [Microbacterium sp. zg.B48]|uniref:NAD(P)-dependent oxidoreductase n=1 Tax=unclassified Microbacterium TaxID=2609290 RepID=UPI00214CC0F5|nr:MULTISPECIES: NAD(P)-dependent oxidoreductase [unclassified Microbacterium]MCR2762921.1 NAD(P)-binding domain-containing protein [Microbacterium sp. zg.B48]MCR2808508.1 NAD(P)-binding domain-containing protein [Microbacterium sp. zg.B185]WIM19052.1 NAD(P)-binding domain-containing protein [Microbacterium sp. zg-B185]
MRIAVLGLGEAGSIYATDLPARGASVIGIDVRDWIAPTDVLRAADIPGAVRGADIVLSLVGASSAASALEDALPAMVPTGVYADMNTSGPADKQRLAAMAAERGIPFVDVAIMAPVPRARIDTPLLLSGSGVARLQPVLHDLRIPATEVGAEPGAAARLKLLRSVFMKGLAAVVVESVTAAELFGAQEWLIGQIASELGAPDRAAVDHLIDGTTKHAVRREAEMIEARELLRSLDAPHPMTDGTIAWLHAIAAENAQIPRS